MKTIKVKFTDFWMGFNDKDNFILDILKKHYIIEISDEPEYLFFSCFSNNYLKYSCVRIFYTGENISPDFNLCDYAMGFEYIDFQDRYLRFPNYMLPEYQKDRELALNKHKDIQNLLQTKTEFCAFVVSKSPSYKGYVDDNREDFFDLLCEYKKVNSGGKFRNNIGQPEGVKDKLEFQMKHKFVIAFENCKHPGYCTEKIVQAFAAKAIPIYYGDKTVVQQFNKNSFINCDDYETFEQVITKIKEIDKHDELYMKMMSEEIVARDNLFEDYENKLSDFLVNILNQPIEKAYRRDIIGWGKKKEDKYKKLLLDEKEGIFIFSNLKLRLKMYIKKLLKRKE